MKRIRVKRHDDATRLPGSYKSIDDEGTIASSMNEDFSSDETASTPKSYDPDELLNRSVQKSWPDIVHPVTRGLNIYTLIPFIIYLLAITSGHLSSWVQFGFVSLSIICTYIIVLIVDIIKKHFP